MAKSGNYIELTAQYEYTETINGVTCTRVFHDGSEPAVSGLLPEIGDSLDPYSDIRTLRVAEIVTKLYGGHPDKKIYTVKYTTPPEGSETDDAVDPNFLPVSGSVTGEVISIDNKTSQKFRWHSGGTNVDQSIPKYVPTGSIKVSRYSKSCPIHKFAEYMGHVNSDSFEVAKCGAFPAGTVLFTGAQVEQNKNSKGILRWKIDFTFEWRYVELAEKGTFGGWQYFYNDVAAEFQMIYTDTGEYLYPEAALMKLLGAFKEL